MDSPLGYLESSGIRDTLVASIKTLLKVSPRPSDPARFLGDLLVRSSSHAGRRRRLSVVLRDLLRDDEEDGSSENDEDGEVHTDATDRSWDLGSLDSDGDSTYRAEPTKICEDDKAVTGADLSGDYSTGEDKETGGSHGDAVSRAIVLADRQGKVEAGVDDKIDKVEEEKAGCQDSGEDGDEDDGDTGSEDASEMEELKVVLCVRMDLKMGKGKIGAQVSELAQQRGSTPVVHGCGKNMGQQTTRGRTLSTRWFHVSLPSTLSPCSPV